jgi:hypothetical protein
METPAMNCDWAAATILSRADADFGWSIGFLAPGRDGFASPRIGFTIAQAPEAHPALPAEEHAAGHEQHAAVEPHAEEELYRMPAEFPNVVTLVEAYGKDHVHEPEVRSFFAPNPQWWLNPAFSIIYGALFIVAVRAALGRRSIERPSRAQVAVEAMFQGLFNFFGEIIGPEQARKYVPYVGSLWLFILVNKLAGLIPGLKTPWSEFEAVFALGLCTFFWVNGNAIRRRH